MSLTLDLYIHLDMIPREDWAGQDDERPLTPLGFKQAEFMAEQLSLEPVHAVYASPNARSRQSIAPLATRQGLPILEAKGFQDEKGLQNASATPSGPHPLASAYIAGTAFATLDEIRRRVPEGRVALCSNGGNIVTALLAFIAGRQGLDLPPRLGPRGTLFTIVMDGEDFRLEHKSPPAAFPG